jgi:hypothetical protein
MEMAWNTALCTRLGRVLLRLLALNLAADTPTSLFAGSVSSKLRSSPGTRALEDQPLLSCGSTDSALLPAPLQRRAAASSNLGIAALLSPSAFLLKHEEEMLDDAASMH